MSSQLSPVDRRILLGRKHGMNILQLTKVYQEAEPMAAIYIRSIHVLRVCHEDNVPFSSKEIRTFCSKNWVYEDGGDDRKNGFFTPRMFVKDCLAYSGKYKLKLLKSSSPPKNTINLCVNGNLNGQGRAVSGGIPLATPVSESGVDSLVNTEQIGGKR